MRPPRVPRLVFLTILWIVFILSTLGGILKWTLPDRELSLPIRTRPPGGTR